MVGEAVKNDQAGQVDQLEGEQETDGGEGGGVTSSGHVGHPKSKKKMMIHLIG